MHEQTFNDCRGSKWEKAAVDLLSRLNSSDEFSKLSIYYTAAYSLDEEINILIWDLLPMLAITGMVGICVALLCGRSSDRIDSKVEFGLAGVVAASMGTAAGMGLLFYLGVEMAINVMSVPFLMLGKYLLELLLKSVIPCLTLVFISEYRDETKNTERRSSNTKLRVS